MALTERPHSFPLADTELVAWSFAKLVTRCLSFILLITCSLYPGNASCPFLPLFDLPWSSLARFRDFWLCSEAGTSWLGVDARGVSTCMVSMGEYGLGDLSCRGDSVGSGNRHRVGRRAARGDQHRARHVRSCVETSEAVPVLLLL